MTTQKWRKPIAKICENCFKEYYITSGKIKQRKYCNLECSVEGKKKLRIILKLLSRPSERKMWLKYWYHRKYGITNPDSIPDPEEANNFDYCHKELYQTKYKPITRCQ